MSDNLKTDLTGVYCLVTGSDGFIGSNLVVRLEELKANVITFSRRDSLQDLSRSIEEADVIFHLAGVNRPSSQAEFTTENVQLTSKVVEQMIDVKSRKGLGPKLIFSSSIQATHSNEYGDSKRISEKLIIDAVEEFGIDASIYRLPGVFGKWCRPYYNSVVATFCHQIISGESLSVNDPLKSIELAYIDDVITCFISNLSADQDAIFKDVSPVFSCTVGELADTLRSFDDSSPKKPIPPVGEGFVRALYATFLAAKPVDDFSYELPCYSDERGEFVEMLKTRDSGQFSYFTAHPGVTRGDHYHHTKFEKFLVVQGQATFHFKHIRSGEVFEINVSASKPKVVNSIPGWSHSITNTGDDILISMLWANEIFDQSRPDTVASKAR